MSEVYSKDGSPEFNRKLHESLTLIADDVEQALKGNLVALILGGGYGRGEGGVVLTDGKEMPYNDLDLTFIVRSKSGLPWEELRRISLSFGNVLGIHVDFSRPLTMRDIERLPSWLMWYDLLNGHVVLKGPGNILTGHAPESLKAPLKAIEGTKLLLNRGAGLLWALRIVRGIDHAPDKDFVRRNYYKCALALGDALLIAYKRYTTKYSGRDKLLEELGRAEPSVVSLELMSLYNEALKFKFRPDMISSESKTEIDLKALARLWGLVLLSVEKTRTGSDWKSLNEYVHWKGIRETDQHTFSLIPRNIVRSIQIGRWSWKYPRESLYRSLPVLLEQVDIRSGNWPGETQNFLKVWNRFN